MRARAPRPLEPAGTCSSSAHGGREGMLLGTAGSLHSLDCFLDFEEPLDDFLGFFIRWYFRASSLSGAAASPDGDGRFLGRKSRQAPSATLSHVRASGRPQWGDRSTPASSAMEKEKVRNPGLRERGQPGVREEARRLRVPLRGVPAIPLRLLRLAERHREPGRSCQQHPTPAPREPPATQQTCLPCQHR